MERRSYLGLVACGIVAGCLGDDGDDGADEDERNDVAGANETAAGFDPRWNAFLDANPPNMNVDMAHGDSALFVGHSGGLTALDRADGAQHWQREDWGEYADVYADDGGVVALTYDGTLVELDPDTGDDDWQTSVKGSDENIFWQAGATAQSVLVSTDAETTLYSRENGDAVREFDVPQGDVVTAADGAVLVLAFEAMGVDPETGTERWRTETRISRGGAIGNGVLVAVETGDLDEGTVGALDVADGDPLWEVDIDHPGTGFVDVAITDGVATLITGEDGEAYTLFAFDVEDGSELWTADLGGLTSPFRPPAADDGVVVTETEDDIRAFDAETGETLATTDRPFSIRGALAEDGLFFEWESDEVAAYDLHL